MQLVVVGSRDNHAICCENIALLKAILVVLCKVVAVLTLKGTARGELWLTVEPAQIK